MNEFTFANNKQGPFSPHLGSTFNSKCPTCGTPTWCCEYPYQTMYCGKSFVDYKGNIVGVVDMNGNVFCNKCYPDKENQL